MRPRYALSGHCFLPLSSLFAFSFRGLASSRTAREMNWFLVTPLTFSFFFLRFPVYCVSVGFGPWRAFFAWRLVALSFACLCLSYWWLSSAYVRVFCSFVAAACLLRFVADESSLPSWVWAVALAGDLSSFPGLLARLGAFFLQRGPPRARSMLRFVVLTFTSCHWSCNLRCPVGLAFLPVLLLRGVCPVPFLLFYRFLWLFFGRVLNCVFRQPVSCSPRLFSCFRFRFPLCSPFRTHLRP